MSLQRMVLVSLFIGVGAVCPSYAGLVIDSFDDVEEGVWPVVQTTYGGPTLVESDLAGVIGGWRDTGVSAHALTTPGSDFVRVDISSGVLDYSSSDGTEGLVLLRYWGDPAEKHLHADLTTDALIRIDFAAFDSLGDASMSIGVSLSSGVWPPFSPFLAKTVTTPGAQSLDFPFAEFEHLEGADLSDLDNIMVSFMPGPGVSFQVDQIATVIPEPASLLLLAVGGLLGIRRARSRRRTSMAGRVVALPGFAVCLFLCAPMLAVAQEHSRVLHLKQETVDTSVSKSLATEAANLAGQTGRFVLQLEGPITPDRRSSLLNAGVVLESYIPSNAYIVTLDGADAQKLAGLSFVRWFGPFQKEWKLDPELGQREFQSQYRIELAEQGLLQVVIVLFPGEDLQAILPELGAGGGSSCAWIGGVYPEETGRGDDPTWSTNRNYPRR